MSEAELSNILTDAFDDPVLRQRIEAEAKFGAHEVHARLAALPVGARVLEIGCGTGALLAILAKTWPNLSFSGVEPIGSGFSPFAAVLDRIQAANPGLQIHRETVEKMRPVDGDPPFDLIFSVNVFEHLGDWRQGLESAMRLLAPGGTHVIICPNYALPFESHFNIPLLGGPRFSRWLFARRIARMEQDYDAHGLWESLNFITSGQLAQQCRERMYDVWFDTEIMGRMLARLQGDADFAKRRAGMGGLARFLDRIGISRLFAALPAGASPYMRAEIKSRG
ncbi:MAG: methyltransferase [Pseudomonadota bacterium]